MQHKYHEVIKAWADGKTVQGRISTGSGWNDFTYWNVNTITPRFDMGEWRIKPDAKTLWYRIYLGLGIYPTEPFVVNASDENGKIIRENTYKDCKPLSDWIKLEYE